MSKKISIAIDGPAAAGKSTTAKIVAKRLNYLYIDTGAMYRALTYKALKTGVDIHDAGEVAKLLDDTEITLQQSETGQDVFLDGEKVTEEIRSTDVTNNVSFTAAHKEVREEMVKRQQALGSEGGVVMDGRDIGTHVLPDAEVKIFLIATAEARAARRHEENIAKGFPSDLEVLKAEIARRDKIDSEREVAPLTKAEDAIEIDTTDLSIEGVVNGIMNAVDERVG
ncbi:(d)CMP kinase [Bacillus marinisedimentorum]|uniref:(d)CMP kinase n=1 Tax=Bacillus marinisedimentorum TaxID=1821260 RepID=UPI000871FF50|nr:(d)CMP kinase [Bacillus marinisedimentorum]